MKKDSYEMELGIMTGTAKDHQTYEETQTEVGALHVARNGTSR